MNQARTPDLEHARDSSERAPKLVMSETFPGTAQQFRAQMQRLYDRCTARWEPYIEEDVLQFGGRWESSDGNKLLFAEYRHRPRRDMSSHEAFNAEEERLSEEDNRPDITPMTRTSWAVNQMNRKHRVSDISDVPEPRPRNFGTIQYGDSDEILFEWYEGQFGCAGIEAYEQPNGTLVEFQDGYDPEFYIEGGSPSTGAPIGPAFEEFCEFVIEEIWPRATEEAERTAHPLFELAPFSVGVWSDADLESLRTWLQDFEARYRQTEFGKHRLCFSIVEPMMPPGKATKHSWSFSSHDESHIPEEDWIEHPDGGQPKEGWPGGVIEVLKVPDGWRVTLWHANAYVDATEGYLRRMRSELLRDGLRLDPTPRSTLTVQEIETEVKAVLRCCRKTCTWERVEEGASVEYTVNIGDVELGLITIDPKGIGTTKPSSGFHKTITREEEDLHHKWHVLCKRIDDRIEFMHGVRIRRGIENGLQGSTVLSSVEGVWPTTIGVPEFTPENHNGVEPTKGARASAGKGKSKRGPRNYSRAEQLAAVKDWEDLDRDLVAVTCVEYLDNRFGLAADGSLKVPKSTFYSWRKKFKNEGLV